MSNEKYIAGGKQLDDLLKTLPMKVQKNMLRSAMRAGAAVYRAKARENVPVHLGALKKSIRITSNSKQGWVRASVKVGNAVAWYAHLVEYGTRAHKIKAAKGRALRLGQVVVAEVDHPGAQAHPFMRPAADDGHAGAIDAVKAKLRERLTLQGLDVPAPEEL